MARKAPKFVRNPFPGLRPFGQEEDYLFFGRDEQIAEVVKRLRENRFLAVVGTSGSGKSSLIRAGLIPSLHRGVMTSIGSRWEIVYTRPGGSPIENLARSLAQSDLYEEDRYEQNDDFAKIFLSLNRSRAGLIEAVRQSELGAGTNVLLIIDQFEELFRYRKQDEESLSIATDFVGNLLEATSNPNSNIFVVITMRSDFLGDCSLFAGLAEAVNRGEYLIPRLNRDELQSAIVGPIQVAGALISNRLVQKLLNCVSGNQDQLPILQHALMRTWDIWARDNQPDEPINLQHFEAAGEIEHAISKHASEILQQLSANQLAIAEKTFKALTELGNDRREIRRPTRVEDLRRIVNCTDGELFDVIDAFRNENCAFLTPTEGTILYHDTVIDISHESLMRVWDTLQEWVQQESQSARIYKRLAETAVLYSEGKSGLYRDPDLQIAVSWQEQTPTNEAWARRYHEAYGLSMEFLRKSRDSKEKEILERESLRQRELEQAKALAELQTQRAEDAANSARKSRLASLLMACLAVAALLIGSYALTQKLQLQDAYMKLEGEKQVAEAAKQRSEKNENIAEAQTKLAIGTINFFVEELSEGDAAGLDPEYLKAQMLEYLKNQARNVNETSDQSDSSSLAEVTAELGFACSIARLGAENKPKTELIPRNEAKSEESQAPRFTPRSMQPDAVAESPDNPGNSNVIDTKELISELQPIISKSESVLQAYNQSSEGSSLLIDRLRAKSLLAELYQELAKYEKARQHRNELINQIDGILASSKTFEQQSLELLNYKLDSLVRLGQIDEAETKMSSSMNYYRTAIGFAEETLRDARFDDSRGLDQTKALQAEALHELGKAAYQGNSPTKTAELFEQSNSMIARVTTNNSTKLKRIQLENYRLLGGLFAYSDPTKSDAFLKEAEGILEASNRKRDARWIREQSRKAWLFMDRGDALEGKNDAWGNRLDYYQRAFALFSRNLELDPDSFDAKRDLSNAHERLGLAYFAKNQPPNNEDLEKARVEFEKMLAIKKELVRVSGDWDVQLELAITYSHFSDLEDSLDNPDKAMEYCLKQQEILDPLYDRHFEEFSVAQNILNVYWRLAYFYQNKDDYRKSLESAKRCQEIVERIQINANRAPYVTRMRKTVAERLRDLEAMAGLDRSPQEILQLPKRQRWIAFNTRRKLILEKNDLQGAMALVQPLEQLASLAHEDQIALVACSLAVAEVAKNLEAQSLKAQSSQDGVESQAAGLHEIQVQYVEKAYQATLDALQSGALDHLILRQNDLFSMLRASERWKDVNRPVGAYRDYAQAVVAEGGFVEVIDDSKRLKVDKQDQLPDSISAIINVNLGDRFTLDDPLLEPLASLVGLRVVMIERIPGLRNEQLRFFQGCKALQVIGLGGNTQIDETGLRHLVGLPELGTLYLGSTNFNTAMAESISHLESLELLDVNTSLITDDALQHLAKIKSLEDLCLTNNAITDRGIEYLKGMELMTLRLNETDVTDACLDSLVELKSLRVLDLDDCNITDQGIAKFVDIPTLQFVNLENLEVTLAGLSRLADLYELRMLRINGTPLSLEDVSELQKRLPFCNVDATTRRYSERTIIGRKTLPSKDK
jgi:energy-coupling factor transporter ATP-binding protein EcfA2